jgi:hypothetical protein
MKKIENETFFRGQQGRTLLLKRNFEFFVPLLPLEMHQEYRILTQENEIQILIQVTKVWRGRASKLRKVDIL